MTILVGDVSLKARWEKTWSKRCCDRLMVGNRRQIIRWQRTKEKCSWGKGSVSARLPVIIVVLVHCHPLLDEKVRRIDQSCRLTSQSREESQRCWIMSGRPRTTSFAESCKPVPQPSAFGSMKVSSKYPTVIPLEPTLFVHAAGPLWARCPPHDVSPYPGLKCVRLACR